MIICNRKRRYLYKKIIICFFYIFLQKKTLFVPEKDVTIMGNDVTITL